MMPSDYANNRYYSNSFGRFMTPDPYQATATSPSNPMAPQSWNRYAYVGGDPINWIDPAGLDGCSPGAPQPCDGVTVSGSTSPGLFLLGGGSGASAAGEKGAKNPAGYTNAAVITGFVTDFQAHTLLGARLQNFASSNCAKVFAKVIQGYSTNDFTSDAQSDQFYSARGGPYSNLTQNQVVGNGVSTTLSNSVPYSTDASTILGSLGTAILLGPNYFSNTNSNFQENALLHEVLHGYTQWSDAEIFSNFAGYGLQQTHPGTIDISDWLSNDCQKTDSTLPSAFQ